MTDHLLLMASNLEQHIGLLQDRCTIHRLYCAEDKDAMLNEVGSKIRVVGTNGHVGCSAEEFEKLPNLEMIGCFGVGYDSINIDVAKQLGIPVTNTPDVLNDAVAELALGLMISLARQIPQSDQFVRAGQWPSGEFPLTTELSGRTVGIVGLGRIGKELARRLQAMKMRVAYHGRNEQPNEPYSYYADIEAMASVVDWLVVCLPGGGDTNHIVSASVLDALGPNGRLVNVARGSVVDEAALCQRIENNGIAGAALDVFAAEPVVPEVLRQASNVVLTPHAASATG
ncbi:MAG: lactate dehydrogenase-like 2-hydroxyacid dehydrogenase, partial [Parasphingorhabdus sp.]